MPYNWNPRPSSYPDKASYAHKYFHRRIEQSDVDGPLIGHDHFDPIDWGKVVREADWEGLDFQYNFWSASGHFIDPDLFEGYRDGKAGIDVVRWHLSLTHADWQSIRRKCRKAYTQQGWDIVFALQGNLLFVIGASHGDCYGIMRIAAYENRYEAVELAYVDSFHRIDDFSTEMLAYYLALLLPGHRFERYWGEVDDDGWYWREPGDPGYIPERKKPWTSFLRHWITLPKEDTEWVDLKLPDENGASGGPLKWSSEQFRVITDDPKLCQREIGFHFLWQDNNSVDGADQEPIMFIMWGEAWMYSVHFTKCADGFIASRALSYTEESREYKYHSCESSTVALEIWECINDLIERKRLWKESRRRKKVK
jgi:hypothetical protein